MSTGIEALRRAKDILQTEAALADAVGVKQPSVHYMLNSGKRVPAEWCLPIERATCGRITRHELRPDLYPAVTDGVSRGALHTEQSRAVPRRKAVRA